MSSGGGFMDARLMGAHAGEQTLAPRRFLLPSPLSSYARGEAAELPGDDVHEVPPRFVTRTSRRG